MWKQSSWSTSCDMDNPHQKKEKYIDMWKQSTWNHLLSPLTTSKKKSIGSLLNMWLWSSSDVIRAQLVLSSLFVRRSLTLFYLSFFYPMFFLWLLILYSSKISAMMCTVLLHVFYHSDLNDDGLEFSTAKRVSEITTTERYVQYICIYIYIYVAEHARHSLNLELTPFFFFFLVFLCFSCFTVGYPYIYL